MTIWHHEALSWHHEGESKYKARPNDFRFVSTLKSSSR
jgi:hypothetical protein